MRKRWLPAKYVILANNVSTALHNHMMSEYCHILICLWQCPCSRLTSTAIHPPIQLIDKEPCYDKCVKTCAVQYIIRGHCQCSHSAMDGGWCRSKYQRTFTIAYHNIIIVPLHKGLGDRVTRRWDTTRGHTCWTVGLGLWLLLLLFTASQCPMAVLCLAKGRLLHIRQWPSLG